MIGHTTIDLTLVERYCVGECTAAERARLEAWVAAAPRHQADFEAYRAICEGWTAATRPHLPGDAQTAWNKLARTVVDPSAPHPSIGRRAVWLRQSWFLQPMIGVAVAAAILVMVAMVVATRRPASQPFREFASAPGGRTLVTLRDGTRITLGADSHLRVAANFGDGNRVVDLEGEGYFAVVHNARHPFMVRMPNATVTDIGTEFDVRAYADEPDVHVAVAQGAVLLRGPSAPTAALTAGDLAQMTNAGIAITHHTNLAILTAWMQGGLAFNNTPLRSAVREIERQFDVRITVDDSTLLNHAMTASFTDASVDEILDAMTFVMGAQYHRVGRTITIRRGLPAGRNASPAHVPPTPMIRMTDAHN